MITLAFRNTLLLFLALSGLGLPLRAVGMACVYSPGYENADYVFVGRVVSRVPPADNRVSPQGWNVEVLEVFKGDPLGVVSIENPSHWGGWPGISEDAHVLLFLNKDSFSKKDLMVVNTCGQSRPLWLEEIPTKYKWSEDHIRAWRDKSDSMLKNLRERRANAQ